MSSLAFRDLRADEMEVRVARANERGAHLLLYKDARCDMRILDETVGPANWQKRFYEHKGTLFCSVGIRLGGAPGVEMTTDRLRTIESDWVWKDDAGAPSNTEAEKGEASDAFKRACFNWGIGRELYTAPFIWVPADRCELRPGKSGKPQCFDRFNVEKVRTEGGRITGLSIWNDTRSLRAFVWQDQTEAPPAG